MILPNLAFDALLWCLILVAAALDSFVFPLHGVASLFIVGGATYWAAQELSDWLLRRVGWTQESLATSVALCAGGFLYFWLRNQSDLALLGLSIGLMMGSLMVAISIIAAIGAVVREGRPSAILGWVSCVLLAALLGGAAGFLAIMLGQTGATPLPLKIAAIVAALALWKGREKLSPPETNPHFAQQNAQTTSPVPSVHTTRVALHPQSGTLLDRLVPLLIFGLILLIAARNMVSISATPSANAAATSQTTPDTATPDAIAPDAAAPDATTPDATAPSPTAENGN